MLGRALDRSEGFLGRVRAVLAGTRGIICFRRDCAGVDVALRVERRRIARELHDALGNRLVVIIMHARRLPESERPAAESIGGLATLAMQDMRQVIGGLHDGVRDDAPPEPQLVSEEAAALAALLPAGRIVVSFDHLGHETVLPATVHRSVLLIVQECVTNGVKHGTGPVEVRLAFGDEVVVDVVNRVSRMPVRSGGCRGHGLGLDGIRTCAREHGGMAAWGEDAGTFRVRVVLPKDGVLGSV